MSDRPESKKAELTAASDLQAGRDIYINSITQIVNQGDAPKPAESPQINLSIDALVEQARSLVCDKIQEQCGIMRLLDISHRVGLDELYVDVNILDDIPNQRWARITDRLQDFDPTADEFERFYLGQVRQARVPGLEVAARNPKLMVLGKPGSGKTTFLKHIAIECNKGTFQKNLVPLFVVLKKFTDSAKNTGNLNLLNYIERELQVCDISASDLETLLKKGRFLILLDGLDEVSEQDSEAVRQEIMRLSERYYRNQFLVTCRTQAQKYIFEYFTYVEVADFNFKQIETFANKWFVAVARNPEHNGLVRATEFIEKLNSPENRRVRELAVTPILLSLTCLVFNDLEDLPTNRANLYERGLNILLSRWDEVKGIQRNEIYRDLSLPRKIKLLSQVAAITFGQSDYFFEQDKIQRYIADYLRTLPNIEANPETLQVGSQVVLESIEVQHGLLVERSRGIYSFSHLTFQEYFTARNFVANLSPELLQFLVSKVAESRWREVFLLTSEMLENADDLLWLMKQQIHELIASDKKIQHFLKWVNQKALSVNAPCQPIAIRAFCFALGFNVDLHLDIDPSHLFYFDAISDNELNAELDLAYALDLALKYSYMPDQKSIHAVDIATAHKLIFNSAPKLAESLQYLKDQLPEQKGDEEVLRQWWQANGKAWTEQLRSVMIKHCRIGHNWQFSEHQKEFLKKYYNANKLLVDCLSSGNVSSQIRLEIEATLLLPKAEIEKQQ